MKKKALIVTTALIFGGCFSTQIFAADLLDVYRQALKSDPSFKASNEQWLAARENLPITRASLLPQLDATAGLSRSHNNWEGVSSHNPVGGGSKFYDNNTNYTLNLTQPIFNFSNWAALWGAKASVKQAEAVFASAAEDLMFRVANAYFSVLQAQDNLRFTIEHKKAVGELLRQQRQKFDVGLIPITDLNDAQASYDGTVAQEIADRNDLSNAEERLQEIVGIKYGHKNLYILKKQLPLVKPEPANIEQWVRTAERQNYSLLAARYSSIAARENIAQKQGGHLPQLDATGSFGYNYDNNSTGSGDFGKQRNTTVGLQLRVPIFAGGGVSAQAQQAGYQYQQAVAQEEQTHRSVVSQTRQAYLGVVSGISKIQADRQEIKSKASVLTSTQNSYTVGLRTMVDVLNAQSDLYDSEKIYSTDQYSYILQTLTLKQQAGTLSANDLAKINLWLEKSRMADALVEKDYSVERVIFDNDKNENKKVAKALLDRGETSTPPETPKLPEVQKTEETPIVSTQNIQNNAIYANNAHNAVTSKADTTLPTTAAQPAQPMTAVQSTTMTQSTQPTTAVQPAVMAQPVQPEAQSVAPVKFAADVTSSQLTTGSLSTTPTPVAAATAAPTTPAAPIVPTTLEATQTKASNTVVATAPEIAQKLAVNENMQPAQPAPAISTAETQVQKTNVATTTNNEIVTAGNSDEVQKISEKSRHLTRPERYILKKVNPKHYTVQLMTSNDRQELVNFAHNSGLQDKTILYVGSNNGTEYYGLIYGDYENDLQANFAMHKLTTKLKSKKIAAKTVQFEVLQEELKISQ